MRTARGTTLSAIHFPPLSSSCAQAVAFLHTIDMPFDRNPIIFYNCKKWLAKANELAYVPFPFSCSACLANSHPCRPCFCDLTSWDVLFDAAYVAEPGPERSITMVLYHFPLPYHLRCCAFLDFVDRFSLPLPPAVYSLAYGVMCRSQYLPNVPVPEHPADEDELEALNEKSLTDQDIEWLRELYSYGMIGPTIRFSRGPQLRPGCFRNLRSYRCIRFSGVNVAVDRVSCFLSLRIKK